MLSTAAAVWSWHNNACNSWLAVGWQTRFDSFDKQEYLYPPIGKSSSSNSSSCSIRCSLRLPLSLSAQAARAHAYITAHRYTSLHRFMCSMLHVHSSFAIDIWVQTFYLLISMQFESRGNSARNFTTMSVCECVGTYVRRYKMHLTYSFSSMQTHILSVGKLILPCCIRIQLPTEQHFPRSNSVNLIEMHLCIWIQREKILTDK